MSVRPLNAMSVDVEDYFQVSAFEPYVARAAWDNWPCRVERNMEVILALFAEHRIKATFFTLGWIAQRYPQLVRRIVAEGHELASHGWSHVRATEQTPAEFAADVRQTKIFLEDLGGVAVRGYRAASYSIGAHNLWALRVLEEQGYQYSSSIVPIRHDLYGIPHAPRFAFYPHGMQGILEIPITTVRFGQRNFPCGGGGWFRLLPYAVSRWAMQHVNQREGAPCVFYFHPWEIDVEQPRPPALRAKTRFRHYLNLHRMQPRLLRLLQDFTWDRMDTIFLDSSNVSTPYPSHILRAVHAH